MDCHKCPLDGKRSPECLKCHGEETYGYPFNMYILDTYDPPQRDVQGSGRVTSLPEEYEDLLRKALYSVFDLAPLELLTLQGIMRGKTLDGIGLGLTELIERQHELIQKNPNKRVTRHHVFQLRKSMLKKLGERFAPALLTAGQKRPLKRDEDASSRDFSPPGKSPCHVASALDVEKSSSLAW